MSWGRWTAMAIAAASLHAGASNADSDWKFRVTPYGWIPTLYTDVAIGPNPPASTDTSLLDVLDFAFLLTGEARKGNWGLIGEFNYLDLSYDASWARDNFGADMSVKGVMAGAAVAYRIAQFEGGAADVFGGFRAWWLDAKIDFDRLSSVSTSKSWVDPIIGVRGQYDLSKKVFVSGLAEIGGFGLGSDLQWEIVGRVAYRVTDSVSAALGYRHLDIDFDEGKLVMDAQMTGPFIAFDFNF